MITRIPIYGAGVIGSLYAFLFTEAGLDVAVYAPGKRAKALQEHGLQYRKGEVKASDAKLFLIKLR